MFLLGARRNCSTICGHKLERRLGKTNKSINKHCTQLVSLGLGIRLRADFLHVSADKKGINPQSFIASISLHFKYDLSSSAVIYMLFSMSPIIYYSPGHFLTSDCTSLLLLLVSACRGLWLSCRRRTTPKWMVSYEFNRSVTCRLFVLQWLIAMITRQVNLLQQKILSVIRALKAFQIHDWIITLFVSISLHERHPYYAKAILS